MATVGVVGAGMMGTAICVPLLDRGHRVHLIGTPLDHAEIEALKAGQPHPRLSCPIPGVLPHFVDALGAVLPDCDLVILGVSSEGILWAADALGPLLVPEAPCVLLSKGLYLRDNKSPGELGILPAELRAALPAPVRGTATLCAIGGPCIAGEIARRVQSWVVLAGDPGASLPAIAALLETPYYHVSTSEDFVGVEVCAALKNAFAMAVSLPRGLHEAQGGQAGSVATHNMEAAIFAEAAREMARVVELLGGDRMTAFGLAGIGDLLVTTSGGRTSRFGRLLGLGRTREQAVAEMPGVTLECVAVLDILARALPCWDRQGRIGSHELPLLRHLVDRVTTATTPLPPLDSFFR